MGTVDQSSKAGGWPVLSLRAVCAGDESFLLQVYASTRADELALTGWTEAQREAFLQMQLTAQLKHYQSHYPEAEHLIILLGDVAVGRLYVARLSNEIRILDVTVLPAYRGRDVGTRIIGRLKSEASATRRPLRIFVESFNPSLCFFEGLGFVKVGEFAHNHLLEWCPPSGSVSPAVSPPE
jgi:GNAT superfamily N-acetyltransferase